MSPWCHSEIGKSELAVKVPNCCASYDVFLADKIRSHTQTFVLDVLEKRAHRVQWTRLDTGDPITPAEFHHRHRLVTKPWFCSETYVLDSVPSQGAQTGKTTPTIAP
jgi:hypothetical protein